MLFFQLDDFIVDSQQIIASPSLMASEMSNLCSKTTRTDLFLNQHDCAKCGKPWWTVVESKTWLYRDSSLCFCRSMMFGKDGTSQKRFCDTDFSRSLLTLSAGCRVTTWGWESTWGPLCNRSTYSFSLCPAWHMPKYYSVLLLWQQSHLHIAKAASSAQKRWHSLCQSPAGHMPKYYSVLLLWQQSHLHIPKAASSAQKRWLCLCQVRLEPSWAERKN